MFDVGWGELLVVGVVALLVLDPKDLPNAFFQVGKFLRSIRLMWTSVQNQAEDIFRDLEVSDIKKQLQISAPPVEPDNQSPTQKNSHE